MMQVPSELSPQPKPHLLHSLFRLLLALLCATAFLSLTLPILAANPGDLDPSFGDSGVVAPSLFGGNFLSNAITIQPDGKIVTAGHDPNPNGLFVVLRHNHDGSFDNNFGNGGVVTSSFSSINNGPGPVGLALQPDGKIVVVGTKSISPSLNVLVVARYTIGGSPDSTFGQGGIVTTTVDKTVGLFIGVAIQADGKIIAAGSSYDNVAQENFSLVRYTLTGTLDSTFGGSGVVTTSIPGTRMRGYGVALQSNGKIVIGGISGSTTFALARYTITGTLDSTFGNSGIVTTSIGSITAGDGVVIQPDDKILIVGSSGDIPPSPQPGTFALARYNPNGALDSGFGNSGIVTATINGYGDGNGVTLQPDGKIVAVGTGRTITNSNTFALVRYNSNGSLDSSFGNNGVIATAIGDYALGYNVTVQADHKIVVVGDSTYASGARYTLARYFGDDLSPTLIPDYGGTVYPTQGVTVTVNGGVFSETVQINYAPHAMTTTGTLSSAGLFYKLDATYLSNGQSAQPQSGQHYTITVTYRQEDVPVGVNEADLALYYWDGTAWVKEPSSIVDALANTITATPPHFSLWAALAPSSGPQPNTYLPAILK